MVQLALWSSDSLTFSFSPTKSMGRGHLLWPLFFFYPVLVCCLPFSDSKLFISIFLLNSWKLITLPPSFPHPNSKPFWQIFVVNRWAICVAGRPLDTWNPVQMEWEGRWRITYRVERLRVLKTPPPLFFLNWKKFWPPRGLTCGPWWWKGRVLNPGLSGKSPFLFWIKLWLHSPYSPHGSQFHL